MTFAVVEFLSKPVHPDSLAGAFIGKLPALMGVLLGFAHWYTNQRDRKTQIKNNHELKLIEARKPP